ncbi:MAG: hypothetical protein AAGK22_29845 [Acidobacteriota bacterium]
MSREILLAAVLLFGSLAAAESQGLRVEGMKMPIWLDLEEAESSAKRGLGTGLGYIDTVLDELRAQTPGAVTKDPCHHFDVQRLKSFGMVGSDSEILRGGGLAIVTGTVVGLSHGVFAGSRLAALLEVEVSGLATPGFPAKHDDLAWLQRARLDIAEDLNESGRLWFVHGAVAPLRIQGRLFCQNINDLVAPAEVGDEILIVPDRAWPTTSGRTLYVADQDLVVLRKAAGGAPLVPRSWQRGSLFQLGPGEGSDLSVLFEKLVRDSGGATTLRKRDND